MTEPTVITTPANPRIKAAIALRDRRDRERTGLTIVDGAREIHLAMLNRVELVELFVCEERCTEAPCRAVVEQAARRTSVSAAVIDRLGFGDRSEGVVAVVRIPSTALADLRLSDEPLVVVLDSVEKPGNVGAVLRSADGAAVDAAILADPRTDPFNPNVIRASLGTAFSVPIAAADGATVRDWLREAGLRVIAARVDGATAYADADLRGPLAIVLGSESSGLGPAWHADDMAAVRLPMLGVADSLNVSAAAAVLLYESRRQRARHPGASGAD
jgi:TrmH family RNA methyltransferase